ncbi:MAG: rhomboid family intramembrane serine protease [Devosia sp.]
MSDDQKNQQLQRPEADPQRQPIFNLHWAVAALCGLLLAIQAADSLVLNDFGREQLLTWLAFVPYRLIEPDGIPGGLWPLIWTPVTHAFLHAGWEHVILNTVWLAIFATPVTLRYGAVKMLALFLLGAIAGAALFAATTFNSVQVLVGASGGIAALTGAAVRFMFQPVQIAVDPETGQRIALGRSLATLREVMAHPTARTFTLLWLVLNAVVPLLPLVLGGMEVQVAWQAHLGGFLFGFFAVRLLERKSA